LIESIWNQFKNAISILIKDDNNVVSEYQFPDYLDFDGWRQITWNNSNYITEVEIEYYLLFLYIQKAFHT